MVTLRISLASAVLLVGCSPTPGLIFVDAPVDDSPTSSCDPMTYEAQAIAFCRAQMEPSSSPGTTGASCASDGQCTSGICLEPFGSGEHYCTDACPRGDECAFGYACQDTGTIGPACYRTVCIYGGSDAADCVSNTMREIREACTSDCGGRLGGWLDCLVASGRICSNSQADARCGIERGLLEECCLGCCSTCW